MLERISIAFSLIGKDQIKMLEKFEEIPSLPLSSKVIAIDALKSFKAMSTQMKPLLLSVLVAAAKCIYIDAMQQREADLKKYDMF